MSGIRGLVFHSRFDYLKKNLDGTAIKKITQELSPQASHILSEQVFLVNKYAFSVLRELDQKLPETVSLPEAPLFAEIGRDFAVTILDRYFFNYVKSQNPQKFLAQFQRLYHHLWDFGRFEYRAETDRKAVVAFGYEEEVHPAYHWFMQAFLKTAIEICGGKKVTLTAADGDDAEEDSQTYTLQWQ